MPSPDYIESNDSGSATATVPKYRLASLQARMQAAEPCLVSFSLVAVPRLEYYLHLRNGVFALKYNELHLI